MSAKKPAEEKIASIAPFGLRMLPELKDQVAEAATSNGRSMNSEIVHRLQSTFPDGNNYKVIVDLGKHLAKELLATAALHDAEPAELIAGIVEDHFRGKTEDFSYEHENPDEIIFKHQKLTMELDRLASELEADFLLYFQKIMQIKMFAILIKSQKFGNVPAEILHSANELLESVEIEEQIAKRRNFDFISSTRREIQSTGEAQEN